MALGGLQEVVDQYVDADVVTDELKEVTLKKVIEALDQKRMELLDIVVHLEKVMCDASNPTGRRNAIQFLAFCLRDKAELKLNFKHVETFAKFFENKLSDWQCVEGAVLGIFVLLKRQAALIRTLKQETENGEVPLAVHLADKMLKEVHVPSHTQAVRKSALDTILLLEDEWHDELTMLGPHLGDGIAAAIEEERDPRNLLASFKVVRKVMADFPAACVSREALTALFDTLSSYFPITFQPPKGDKIGITGDDLREALSQAFSASPRFTDLVVPFLLDASKDIEADVDATVAQAMQTLVFCLEKFGASAAQKHLKDILATARDQVCRTKTTCARDFCRCVVESLKIAMTGVPAGLHPSWVAKDVVPELNEMAEDASKGRMSLASEGARQLLLAAAASHPVIYEYVWSGVMAAFLESETSGFSADALTFMEDMLQLRQEGVLSPKQLQPALRGALTTLRSLTPDAAPAEPAEAPGKALVAAVGLVKRLALAAPQAPSAAEALDALQSALLGGDGGSSSSAWAAWAEQWQKELSSKTYNNECVTALVTAVCDLLPSQLERSRSVAHLLLKLTVPSTQWLPLTLPRLLAFNALSLSEAASATPQDTELSNVLLKRAADLFQSQDANGHKESLLALADALDRSSGKTFAVAMAKALGLPSSVPQLSNGFTTDLYEGAPPSVDVILQRAEASRRFLRSLMGHLPADQAKAVQRRLLEFVALNTREPLANSIGLLPGILPEACEHSWTFCRKTMAAVCRCASGADPDLATSPGAAGAETLAMEALEALVESCPKEEVSILLENFRDTFGRLLRGGQAALTEKEGLGAALCWASVTAALLRRDNAQQQAASFLEALLKALDDDAVVGPFVPMAFRVLAPVKVESAKASRAKLPPLALQQLSRTVLPSLIARAKGVKAVASAPAKRAALESAVALLAGLSPEVACNDCSEELRFCTLTSLKRLKEEPEATVFAAQALQLLVRAIQKQQSWVEDDLHSVVIPICDLCSSHRVPLVRLGCFQVMIALIQQAFGHLAPLKKQIQAGCKAGVEDRCREVRLLAVAALNTWHCVGSQ